MLLPTSPTAIAEPRNQFRAKAPIARLAIVIPERRLFLVRSFHGIASGTLSRFTGLLGRFTRFLCGIACFTSGIACFLHGIASAALHGFTGFTSRFARFTSRFARLTSRIARFTSSFACLLLRGITRFLRGIARCASGIAGLFHHIGGRARSDRGFTGASDQASRKGQASSQSKEIEGFHVNRPLVSKVSK